MDRGLAAAWVDGWVVSRGTSAPRPTPWGLRVEVHSDTQSVRYVMLDAHEPIVRDLATRASVPKLWMKAFVEPEILKPWLTPEWRQQNPAWMMTVDLEAHRVQVPEGYSIGTVVRDGVIRVTVSAKDGAMAAKGLVGLADGTGTVDQVSTEPEHQRRGLGTVVLRALANEALEAGASVGILGATVQGRALYEYLGWKVHAPLAGFVFRTDGPQEY